MSPAEVAEAEAEFHIQEVPESFVLCRTLGHAWNRVRLEARDNSALLVIQCQRCNTLREDELDRYGAVPRRRYQHPEGYLHRGHKVERYEYRLELVQRARKESGNGGKRAK